MSSNASLYSCLHKVKPNLPHPECGLGIETHFEQNVAEVTICDFRGHERHCGSRLSLPPSLPRPRITYCEGSQLPCPENTQAALWRGLPGNSQQQRSSANSHVIEPSCKQPSNPQLTRRTAALPAGLTSTS